MSEDKWQQKYYRVLDRFEKEENRWAEDKDRLMRGLMRVSHVGNGIADELDKALKQLRKAIQKQQDADAIDKLVSAVADAMLSVDSARSSEPEKLGLDPGCLIRPFEAFYLPVPIRKRLAVLEEKIRSPSVGTAEFLADYGDFLKSTLSFFAEQWVESKENPDADFASEQPELVSPEQSDALREQLLRLVDALPVPEDYNDRVLAVRDQLVNGVASKDLPEQLSALVDAMLAYTEDEREGLTNIANEIAARIDQFSDFTRQVEVDQSEGDVARQALDDDMRSSLSGMQEAVENASSLAQLQRHARGSLSELLSRLDEFMTAEQQRREGFRLELQETRDKLGQAEQESARLRNELQHQRERSLLDPLTRLPNRQSYDLRIKHEFERWRRYGGECSVVMLDLDYFKPINDEFGHLAGDKVLRVIGKLVREQVRATDFAGRYGGEEFVLVLPGVAPRTAQGVAEKVRKAVAGAPFHFRDRRVDVTMSLGVSGFLDGDTHFEQAVERADQALYVAKENGRNRVEVSLQAR